MLGMLGRRLLQHWVGTNQGGPTAHFSPLQGFSFPRLCPELGGSNVLAYLEPRCWRPSLRGQQALKGAGGDGWGGAGVQR